MGLSRKMVLTCKKEKKERKKRWAKKKRDRQFGVVKYLCDSSRYHAERNLRRITNILSTRNGHLTGLTPDLRDDYSRGETHGGVFKFWILEKYNREKRNY